MRRTTHKLSPKVSVTMPKAPLKRAEKKSGNAAARVGERTSKAKISPKAPDVAEVPTNTRRRGEWLKRPAPALIGQLAPKLPRVCRDLRSVEGWLTEMSALYRAARRGILDSAEASRLAWICSQASKLAKDLEEMRHWEALRSKLAATDMQRNALPWDQPEAAETATDREPELSPVIVNGVPQ